MKYFIADTHFYHEPIIKFSNRPFKSVEEMNQKLIQNWNETVKSPEDEVYVLGDFVYHGSGEQANEILKQLHGKKYLIRGNHEEYLDDPKFDKSLFEWIKDYYTFKCDGRKFVLFHYPILEWDDYYIQAIHLYGHVHNIDPDYFTKTLGGHAVNVGVDMTGYKPISMDDVVRIVDDREMSW